MPLTNHSIGIGRARGSSSLIMRFSVITGIALLALAMVSMFVSHFLERAALLTELEKQTARAADLLAQNVASSMFTFNKENISATVAAFASDPRPSGGQPDPLRG